MLFFTDLDNTILYSHRHAISSPKVWVEKLNDRNQSFISEQAYNYYLHQDWLKIVPVTTRTRQQYLRLMSALSALGWNEALICNGAIRIVDGVEDIEWTNESLQLIGPAQKALKKMYVLALELYGETSIVLVDPFLFYIKNSKVNEVFDSLFTEADSNLLQIYKDSRKVYCVPKVLNKGTAIERYKSRFHVDKCIAAGDSDFDVPMLQKADIVLYPEYLKDIEANGEKYICDGLFSDQICEYLEKLRRNLR